MPNKPKFTATGTISVVNFRSSSNNLQFVPDDDHTCAHRDEHKVAVFFFARRHGSDAESNDEVNLSKKPLILPLNDGGILLQFHNENWLAPLSNIATSRCKVDVFITKHGSKLKLTGFRVPTFKPSK